MSIGEFLIDLRKKHSLSRTNLAEISGFNPKTIEAYESDNPKIKRTISEDYKDFIAAHFGISTDIFKLEDITEADIEKNKLTKFSQCLRQFVLWGATNSAGLVGEVFSITRDQIRAEWLINIKESDTSVTLAYKKHFETIANMAGVNFESESEKQEFINSASDSEYNGEAYQELLLLETAQVVEKINKFKPSSFGLDLDKFEELITVPFKLYLDSRFIDILHRNLRNLEKKGIEFNYENVKRSISEGVILDDEQKELIELWSWAGDGLKENIIEILRENKEHNLKHTQNVLKLSGLTKKEE